ncbi:hypothetical protein DID88_006032 [Monilinia fructigena]|uniref:Uncharacterized protein n=1 Tax=Monilinia fructigena TaxID=38457 RepID=A0A395J401_9HELO|nr:hypothetical protein DID88_006032 [Monilinia fructigena]
MLKVPAISKTHSFKNYKITLTLQRKGAPISTTEHSKSGQHDRGKQDTRSNRSQSQGQFSRIEEKRSNTSLSAEDKKWATSKDALQGINQSDIDQRKKEKILCWRCGRNNHHTLECFARKDTAGKDLPSAAVKVSATKRKLTEDKPAQPSSKRVKIDAVTTQFSPGPSHQFMELEDSDQDFKRAPSLTHGTKPTDGETMVVAMLKRRNPEASGTNKRMKTEPQSGTRPVVTMMLHH